MKIGERERRRSWLKPVSLEIVYLMKMKSKKKKFWIMMTFFLHELKVNFIITFFSHHENLFHCIYSDNDVVKVIVKAIEMNKQSWGRKKTLMHKIRLLHFLHLHLYLFIILIISIIKVITSITIITHRDPFDPLDKKVKIEGNNKETK